MTDSSNLDQPPKTQIVATKSATQAVHWTEIPVVGIGASAGGLAAFEAFLSGLPADADMGIAFVLVQHLAPDHKSILSEILRRATRLQIMDIEEGMLVEPNVVYVIPPGYDLALNKGSFQLLEPTSARGHRLPIDFFFRTLADSLQERAIGIILSGTGSDGSQGVREIKAAGGMVMAQDSSSTDFDGMPRSAIATGVVDFVLSPVKMAAQLLAYISQKFEKLPKHTSELTPVLEVAMKKIFQLLRSQTGHDFSLYKPSTIYRRIERRMAVNEIEDITNYVKHMKQNPIEVEALFRDLLIGVTHFFRDTDAFRMLEKQTIPAIFASRSPGETIRVWVTGCSTGEEAYSIAMLLVEHMEAENSHFNLQMFATDISSESIAIARAGIYPASILADVSPERLARFFTVEPDGSSYRVRKSIRDLLIFSEQDLIKDPPFSKLDLISCRNLLIYMSSELQKRIIPLFHYSLKPNGWLLLGTSEGIGEFEELFQVFDRKAKVYRRKELTKGHARPVLGRFIPPLFEAENDIPVTARKLEPFLRPTQQSLREMTEQTLLSQLFAAGALVNAQGDILYLHGRTGMFLEMPPGVSSVNNIIKMAREGLRYKLSSALESAVSTREAVTTLGVLVKTNGHYTKVNLTVCPVINAPCSITADAKIANNAEDSSLYVIIMKEAVFDSYSGSPEWNREELLAIPQIVNPTLAISVTPELHPQNASSDQILLAEANAKIAALQEELQAKEEYLQSTYEELESSSEELKSSNEEMQSVNEELQSTNEELETSKEELQSVNEELATVNTELQTKVNDLSRLNNDMNNLLAGTDVGTVFVDHQLRILRFTPAASSIINLIPSDVGRPVAHLVSNLVGYNSLVSDTQSVLDTLVRKELEVQTIDGRNYNLRIHPYRTLENIIEGAVITFVDITAIVRARTALRDSNELLRLAIVIRDARDAVIVRNLEGRIIAWNPGATRMYGWNESEALAMNVRDCIPPAESELEFARMKQLCLDRVLQPYQTKRLTKSGEVVPISMIATALVDESDQIYAISTTERTIHGDGL